MAGFAAATLFETKAVGAPPVVSDQLPFDIITELGSYAAWRMLEEASDEKDGALSKHQEHMRSVIADFGSEAADGIEKARQTYVSATSAIDADLSSLSERVSQTTEAAKLAADKAASFEGRADALTAEVEAKSADMAAKYETAEEKARAFMAAVRTEANFEDLKIHWVNRANSAWWALFWSGLVLFLLLVLVPAAAILESGIIQAFIKGLTDAATVDVGDNPGPVTIAVATISRLVVITIPLALYFWLIRLVVRFNMRSMLLMDDARQRATMLETYYRMIERGAAMVEDRALVLQALLRPAPGHGSDSVEPPNFTEVIDRAMGKA